MAVAKGSLASIAGNPLVWEVLAVGPYWVKVRPADLSLARTAVTVPIEDVSPYDPSA
jgi:hypothetical protein